ncbi:MAG: PrgI family protein [Candidatus Sungbacteria bacterium]|uniref:PrgI family protein n=1 Tax=Candidatus Sungiibacteriota bacterium TaxID=2750080 RepID=A0A9D6HQJ2_9BACT|nr:PrgI family protein [Candidatus Sungbacteria bacterium]
MQFQVPQFIETEDKIVGPLTLKQFGFLAAGGTVGFMAFMVLKLTFAVMIAVPVGALALVLAFGKIKGLSAPKYILSMIGFALKPQMYLWRKK